MESYHFFLSKIEQNNVILEADEWKHARKSLRLGKGDKFFTTDGKGTLYLCEIETICKDKGEGKIISSQFFEKDIPELIMVFGILKHPDRMEWMIEKCTELGVTKFIPVITQNTIKKNINIERLQRLILAACKQSKKLFFPQLMGVMSIEEVFQKFDIKNKFIAHCYQDNKKKHISTLPKGDTLILIGPEGDFSPDEIKIALQSGFQSLSLGNDRLRSETAAVFAASAFKIINFTKTNS
jgi:16S rRNA (uracil1498-N3)-methyltransferase